MKTLRITSLLFFVVTSFIVVHGATLKAQKRIIFKTTKSWSQNAGKSVLFIPLDAYVVDNNCIAIQFFCKGDSPSTFQIKDNDGHLIFQDILYLSEDDVYRIDIDGFNSGKYSLIYCDEYVEITGEFEKE